ncbi:hypothetical protein FOMPIDRAFT_1054373 [Fomitopsis schrenkii]|uniref:Uncharacterized protein n=1 Tax=Fomitopsis schrenkii TaxID=2126942 RepID=S8DPK3_FOMSC|nr:hypothetical protein FOMPIDRAFT_1054373 [Fomitopsis schrenkii]
MIKPRIHSIAYPDRLSLLLADQHDWIDIVIVTEVYTCRSYARLLTRRSSKEITVGLGATLPMAPTIGLPVSASVDVDMQWHTNCASGDWKSAHFERGKSRRARGSSGWDEPQGGDSEEGRDSDLCYPLLKLVALRPPYKDAPVSILESPRPPSRHG